MTSPRGGTITPDNVPLPGVTIDQAHDAACCVARHCPDDAAMILTALGLLEAGRIVVPRWVAGDVENRPQVTQGWARR